MLKEILPYILDETRLHQFLQDAPSIILIIVGILCIVMLLKGADWLITGVVHMARRTGLPEVVIGATIVSLGTTTPEAFVSVMAAWMGKPGLALGNGVGSIIADTGLIFGITCIFSTIPINRFILNRTGWAQVGAATLLVIISLLLIPFMDGIPVLSRWVGALFLALLIGYMYITYVWARQGTVTLTNGEVSNDYELMSLSKSWLIVISGLFFVGAGARILIPCVSEIARRLSVPNDVIAATIVAFGTSLPELMTAVAAVRKGHPEIMVGNIVGADVLNCLFVIGAAAAARPLTVPPNFYTFHYPAMILILYSFRFFIFMNKEGYFRRWQGAWLFCVYLIYLILQYAFNIGKA